MRKLVLSINITMDGLMAGPHGELDWHYAHWSDEMALESNRHLQLMGAIIVGRVTYEAMVRYWSQVAVSPLTSDRDRSYAHLICGLPKIVFSYTMQELSKPQSKLAKGRLVDEVMYLKHQAGKDIISWGGINMAHALIEADLVDEYWLWVAPVILQEGVPLFINLQRRQRLKLIKMHAFSNGVTLFKYQV
ncbi:dihydrofolate reductase family protein [Mucilaginibacter sp. PAMB04168]|uniref:dihydrofolate reductase family protein n=1 Tax=Mucilaginibacter sp. PAMB04168 TaxID=3138567 RepID=UPI0031F692D4